MINVHELFPARRYTQIKTKFLFQISQDSVIVPCSSNTRCWVAGIATLDADPEMKAVNSDASVPGSEPSGRRSLLEDLYACPKCPRRFCSGRALGGHLAAHQRMDRTMEKEGDGSSVTSKYSPRVAFRAPAGQRVAPYYVSHMPHKYCNSSLPEKPAPPHLDLDLTSNGFNSVVANAGKLVSKDSEPLDSTDAGLIPPPPATDPRVAFRNAGLLFNPADEAQFELLQNSNSQWMSSHNENYPVLNAGSIYAAPCLAWEHSSEENKGHVLVVEGQGGRQNLQPLALLGGVAQCASVESDSEAMNKMGEGDYSGLDLNLHL